jgi:MoaA/NifB/PqqE/SkfB family radical SAM enzyme
MTNKLKPCILPWINFGTNPFGRSRPCGYSSEKSEVKVQDSSISEQFNNSLFRQVRLDFLSGQWPKNCQRCEYAEKSNSAQSKKASEEIYYQQHSHLIESTSVDGFVKNFPKHIDIRLGTLCNLKCIHCGTGNSSKWNEDKNLIGNYENTEALKIDNSWVDHTNSMWEDVLNHLDEIEKFNFLGGEPFASRQHRHLLKTMSSHPRQSEIILHYVTNGTLLTEETIDQLSGFKKVTLNISLDATGKVLDYFRYPINSIAHERIFEMITRKIGPDSSIFNIGLQWTSSNVSLFYLAETLSEYEKKWQKKFEFLFCNYVDRPHQMSPQNLPKNVKNLILKKLSPWIEKYPQIQFYVDHMNATDLWPSSGPVFLDYLRDLDEARNMNWKISLSELHQAIQLNF